MKKEMFENILQKEEKVIWAEGVNKKSFMIKYSMTIIAVFAFIGIFVAQFVIIANGFANFNVGTMGIDVKLWPITWGIVFAIGIIFGIIFASLEANNTFFAITDKRIIKRSGLFNQNYIHYSLKNIGTVSVHGSVFDSKGPDGSATLIITVKDFHTNTDGNTMPMRLSINSLNKAYKAYNLLSEQTEGNNESFRVKIEK